MAEDVRKSVRLQRKVTVETTQDLPSAPVPTAAKEHSELSAGALRLRRFKERLKNDPEKYAAYKEKNRQHALNYRRQMTPEQKKAANHASTERTRKCRAKKKVAGQPLNTTPAKPSTRAAVLKQREKERLRKAAYRASLNSYQKSWVNQKRREARAAKSEAAPPLQVAQDPPVNFSSGYKSNSGKKAAAKALTVLPTSPSKFAAVVDHLTNIKSPRKRKALEEKGIHPPATRRKIEFSDALYHQVTIELKKTSKERNKHTLARRRVVSNILSKYHKYRGYVTHLRTCGTTRQAVQKYAKSVEIPRKRRRDALSHEITRKVTDFFFYRGDISRTDPCVASVSAKTGKTKTFMEKTLKETYLKFLVDNPEVRISFSKFAKLKPQDTKATHHNTLRNCKCEKCMKVELCLISLNKFLARKDHRDLMINNKRTALEMTLCPKVGDLHLIACIDRKCTNCGVQGLRKHLENVLEEHAGSATEWNMWCRVEEEYRQSDGTLRSTKKWRPVQKTGPFEQLISEMEEELLTFSMHLFNADWQQQQYSNLRQNLPEKWLLLVSEFGQNYSCLHQDEIQGAHWTRSEVTIHPVVAFYHDQRIQRECFMFLSNNHKHDAHAVYHFEVKTVQDLLHRGFQFNRVIHFSDGCASQYKGKTTFVDLSFAEEDHGIMTERHYFGSRHGKGPCDAEIGILKKSATMAVKRRAAVISDTQTMYEWAVRSLTRQGESIQTRRKFFFIAQGAIERNRPNRTGQSIRTLQGTRSLHSMHCQAPYVVSWCKRSCFCEACITLEGDCIHEKHCGTWQVFHLLKRQGTTEAADTAVVDDVDLAAGAGHDDDVGAARQMNGCEHLSPEHVPSSPVNSLVYDDEDSSTKDQTPPSPSDGTGPFEDCGINSVVVVHYPEGYFPGVVVRQEGHNKIVDFFLGHMPRKGVSLCILLTCQEHTDSARPHDSWMKSPVNSTRK